MGFLRNIFGFKKDNVEKVEKNVILINISDIDEWVKTNCSDIDSNYFSRKFSDILEEISQNADKLSKVKFEPDTDPRIKQRVESNIEAYVKHLRAFIKKIDVSLVKEDTINAITSYEKNLSNFNVQTQKNFLIASALFKDESFRVSNSIRNFSLTLSDLKKGLLDDKSILGLDIYGKISKVRGAILSKDKFLLEEKEKKAELEATQKEISDKGKEVEDFTQSKEYKEIINSDKRKEVLEKELENIKSDVFSIVSVLEPAFRRLIRIMPNIDLKEISLDRILDLKNNKVFEYSNELKESLKSLDIKADKKEKVSLVLQKVLDGTLKSLIDEYTKKIQDIKNIDTMMIDSQVSKIFIDLNYKINSLDYKKNRLQSEIDKIDKRSLELEQEFDVIIKDLEGVLGLASGYKVKINF